MSQSTEPAGTPEAAGPATPHEPPVTPGTVLAGKYRVERVIGQGGMGVVVEARHIALDDRVALKFLTASYAKHPEATARFLREGKAAVKIKSEHVARVSDVGTLENGSPYMVMEFLQGRDLSQELVARGPLPREDAVDYILQGCEAIHEAHAAGIVHRDIKPANLFLTRRHDGSALVKVLDFGISKMAEGPSNLTGTTTAMGSALYMSPEQMQQTRGVDHRTDIYALGIALYELLAGKQPYYADTLPQLIADVLTGTPTPLQQVRPDLPPPLGAVLEKAYARDRAQRYGSVAELVVALAPFAPPRSQPNIDRIARSAGLTPPVAGAPAPAAVPAGGPSLAGGGTISMEAPRIPLSGGTIALDPATPPANPQPPPAPPPPVASAAPGQPAAPPGYAPSPPVTPAIAPATAPGMVIAAPAQPASRSKAPLFIGMIVAFLGLAAGGFLWAGKGSAPPAPASPATPAETAVAPAPSPPPPAATPAATPAAPDVSAAAKPDAKPALSTAPKGPAATAPTTKPTAAPKSTGAKPKSIFDDR